MSKPAPWSATQQILLALPFLGIYADAGRRSLAAVFPGVAQQIAHHDFDHARVAVGLGIRLHLDRNLAFRFVLRQFSPLAFSHGGKVDHDMFDFSARAARQRQQAINQLVHLVAGNFDLIQEQFGLALQLAAEILLKRLAEADHGAKRRAQVMRNGVGETVQFLVGGGEYGGAFDHALFQVGVDAVDIRFGAFPLLDVFHNRDEVVGRDIGFPDQRGVGQLEKAVAEMKMDTVLTVPTFMHNWCPRHESNV